MSALKVLNCRLNATLNNKLSQIKTDSGLDSDAECVRYLINLYEFMLNALKPQKKEELDERLERAIATLEEKIPQFINEKFKGKLPSLKEQRRRLIA